MLYVFMAAGGIALCSFAGAAAGFMFSRIPPKAEDLLTAAAAGIMLCAAVLGLVVPAVEFSDSLWLTPLGIMCGAVFLRAINAAGPYLAPLLGMTQREKGTSAVLFVAAIAIHHFPEGIAAGVSFGTGDLSDAVAVAGAIAIQNLPEAMVMIPPLLTSGAPRRRAVLVAFLSAAVEIAGVFMGYFAVTLAQSILPAALSFAAGTMLYVVADDMLPRTRARSGAGATFCALSGFCLMLLIG